MPDKIRYRQKVNLNRIGIIPKKFAIKIQRKSRCIDYYRIWLIQNVFCYFKSTLVGLDYAESNLPKHFDPKVSIDLIKVV